MAEEKKLVIKINYPNRTGKLSKTELPAVEYVTEWNIKRLAGAAALVCLLMLGGYFWLSGKEQTDKYHSAMEIAVSPPATIKPAAPTGAADKSTNAEQQVEPLNHNATQSAAVNVNSVILSVDRDREKSAAAQQVSGAVPITSGAGLGRVVRGELVDRINNKEPQGRIRLPLLLRGNDETTLYYFTELQDMTGKLIYHEWLYKGKSVFKRPIKITEPHWRTATHKIIRSNALGDWTVRVVGENGVIMHKIDFKVAAAN